MRKKAYTVRYINDNKVILLFVLLLVMLTILTLNVCESEEQNSQVYSCISWKSLVSGGKSIGKSIGTDGESLGVTRMMWWHCVCVIDTLCGCAHQSSPKHTQLVALKPLTMATRNGTSVQFALYENIETIPAYMAHHLDSWIQDVVNVHNVVLMLPDGTQICNKIYGKKVAKMVGVGAFLVWWCTTAMGIVHFSHTYIIPKVFQFHQLEQQMDKHINSCVKCEHNSMNKKLT